MMAQIPEQRSRITQSDALARYLPAPVAQRLLEAPHDATAAIDQDPYIARLRDLLQLVVSYIPEYTLAAHASPEAPALGRPARVDGTLLGADLSGFTAFSARLGTLGSEGAELIARTMSDLFGALFDTLGRWNGSLLKLSGDALTAVFSGPAHAQQAAAAALALQEQMRAFEALATPVGVFTLRMRIGLASGPVFLSEVGTPERVELLVAGPAARRVVEVQRLAAPGSVVLSQTTCRAAEATCRTEPAGPNAFRLLAVDAVEAADPPPPRQWQPRSDKSWELQALVARLEQLRPYLVEQHLDRLSAGPLALAGDGDIRPVTVLFACLADAGPLLERSTSSDANEPVEQLQATAQQIWEIVAGHGGTINKLDLHADGQTLVALFGAPVASGDEADRAIGCALALLRECGTSDASGDDGLALRVRRVGLATGRVFAGAVGSQARREYTVMGPVVNLAARLMDLAADGQALIDDRTAGAARRRFRLQQQQPVPVKGYDEPMPLFLAGGEQRARLGALMRDRTPLVGRAAELAQAAGCVSGALHGSGCVVALIGEAGIGKSRLLAEIARSLPVAPGPLIALAQAQPQTRNQPYALIIDLLRQLYDLPSGAEQAARALGEAVGRHAASQERFLPLLLAMMGLPAPETAITQALAPDERLARLNDLVIALLLANFPSPSAALLLEDLHWIDPASWDLLSALARQVTRRPLLIVCTYRPENGLEWPADAPVTTVALGGLGSDQSRELLERWMEGQPVLPELSAAAVERTQGNPLFIVETARTLRDHSPDATNAPPLPATVQGALLARLDRLAAEDRYVLRLASVVGPRFQRSVLGGLVHSRVRLGRVLERLTTLGFLQPEQDDDQYGFTHSLLQETAYESLLFAQRRELHRRVGDRLRAMPGRADDEPGLLAFHYRRAEAWPEALECSWRAGNRAQALFAGSVALGHYQHALEAVERLGAAAEPHWRATLLQRCGDLHALAGHYDEAVDTFRAALDAAPADDQQVPVLLGWAEACEQRAHYDQALALLDQAIVALGDRPDDPLVLQTTVRRGWVLARQGLFDEARAAVEPCLELLDAQERWRDLLLAYKVFCLIAIGQSRWGEARVYSRLAIGCAERVGDVREIARVSNNLSFVLTQEGKLHAAAESCRQAAEMMEQIGDRYNLSMIKSNTGVIFYKLGNLEAALDYYGQGLEIATAIGAPLPESIVRNNLGEIYRQFGRLDESVEQLNRSVELCEQIGDDLGLAEGHRQLAETYAALGQLDRAAACAKQSHASALAAGNRQAEAIASRVRGLVLGAQGADDDALEVTQHSIRMLSELGSTQELGQSMVAYATIMARRGQTGAARAMLEEAIVLFRKAGAAGDEAHAEQLLAQTHNAWLPGAPIR